MERIGSQLAALPPLEEQVEIVAKLDAALFHTERVIQRINAQLERIREYRQALITAAVTGKLDLSKEAA